MSGTLYKAALGETASDVRRLHQPRRIVIVGGGFAGVAAARALRRCNAEVILSIDETTTFSSLSLYQIATAVLAPSDIAAPIRQLARRQNNLSVMFAEVTGVGRRRPDWREIGGIDCANGHHHAAGEFQADRPCEDLNSFA